MKFCFKCALLTILWYFTIIPCNDALPDTVNIGGLFDNDYPNQELAFRLAIDRVNENHILGSHKLVPQVERVDSNNVFQVSQTVCSVLNNGVVGIFGPNAAETSKYVQSMCDTMEIPHVETSWDVEQERGSCLVNLYPYPASLSLAYAKLVLEREWKNFVILYEDSTSMVRISELLKLNDHKQYTISVRQLSATHSGDYRKTFKEVRAMGLKNFVIDCHIENLDEVLRQAQQVGLMTEEHSYIITSLDMHTIDLAPYQWGGSSITGIRLVDPESEMVMEAALKLQEMKIKMGRENQPLSAWSLRVESALLIDAVVMFSYALKQLNKSHKVRPKPLFCNSTDNWEQGYSIINYMKTHSMKGLTGLIKFDYQGFRSDFMVDVVELKEGGLIKMGNWNATLNELQYVPTEDSTNINDENTLRNKTLRVLICLTDPYGMLKEESKLLTGNDRFEGFGIDLIDLLAKELGFKYIYLVQEDGANGAKNQVTGEWNGMVRELLDRRADLAITDFTITSEREEAVDFTHPFMNLGIAILFKKPKPVPSSLFSFAAPFSMDVWATLAFAYLIVSFMMFVIGRMSSEEWTNPFGCIEEPEFLYNQFSFRNSYWFTMGTLMQQGCEIAPIAVATRMVAGIWWFFALIMVSSYTANLAACLTVETVYSPFSDIVTLAQKVEEGEIVVGAKDGGATANFFRDSKDETHQNVWNYMNTHKEAMTANNSKGVERAESDTEQYAFFMESSSIDYIRERHCTITQVGQELDNKGYGIAMRKNSTYRHMMSSTVVRLQENGQIDLLKKKWWKEKRGGGECDNAAGSSAAVPLNLANVGGVFFVLVVGTAMALFLVFVEMILHVARDAYENKISFSQEIKEELAFFFKFKGLTKPVRNRKSESPGESNKTLAEGGSNEFNTPAPYGFIVPDITKQQLT